MTQPEALLLVSPHCQHCRGMHDTLDEFVDSGILSRLTVVDIFEQPNVAEQLGVRSVPWLRLDGFVLEGAHTPGELRNWIEASTQENGWSKYLEHLLQSGKLQLAEDLVHENPERLNALVSLAANADTTMHVRVGIAAILEGLQGTDQIKALVPAFSEIADSTDEKVRADACHFLALTGAAEAVPVLEKYSRDKNQMVREIAAEGLQDLELVIGTR